MTQAWNIYAFGEPIIEHFFGIQPRTYEKEITISPLLPLVFTKQWFAFVKEKYRI